MRRIMINMIVVLAGLSGRRNSPRGLTKRTRVTKGHPTHKGATSHVRHPRKQPISPWLLGTKSSPRTTLDLCQCVRSRHEGRVVRTVWPQCPQTTDGGPILGNSRLSGLWHAGEDMNLTL